MEIKFFDPDGTERIEIVPDTDVPPTPQEEKIPFKNSVIAGIVILWGPLSIVGLLVLGGLWIVGGNGC